MAFCGGSGVTPVLSIAKEVLTTSTRTVRLLYANRDRRSVIFHAELDRLSEAEPDRLTVRHHLDEDGGFLDAAAVAGFVGPDVDADYYICGPTPFMDLVESTLLDLGVDRSRIAIERFSNSQQEPEPATAGVPDDANYPGEAPSGAVSPENVTIILNRKRSTIAYQAGDTVLQTARRGGLQAPFSCEAGNCATCMAHLEEGSATMRTNNALTPDEVEDGWILTCQAVPEGETVTVEYEAM